VSVPLPMLGYKVHHRGHSYRPKVSTLRFLWCSLMGSSGFFLPYFAPLPLSVPSAPALYIILLFVLSFFFMPCPRTWTMWFVGWGGCQILRLGRHIDEATIEIDQTRERVFLVPPVLFKLLWLSQATSPHMASMTPGTNSFVLSDADLIT